MSEVEVEAPTPTLEETTTMSEVAAPTPEETTVENETAAIPHKAPGAIYGEIDDAAYNLREAKILADKHGSADKADAIRHARAAAAAKGEAWTEDVPVPVIQTGEPNGAVAPKAPGAVYGEIHDAAYKIREAKILNAKSGTADKGRALKNARIAAAARGETWTPNVAVPELPADTVAPKAKGVVYGEIDDVAFKLREAKILADTHGSADKGRGLKAAKVKAAATGEAWAPNVPGTDQE